MLDFWIAAFGLMLVLEGMMPFVFPSAWRAVLRRASALHNDQARFIGLSMILTGFLVVYLVRQ